jgi:hypothetical protein
MIWVLLNLMTASALLALYMWVLMRIGHGGKGWPRLRRKRTPNRRSQTRRDLPAREAVNQFHRVR